jgi:hypothetical protein
MNLERIAIGAGAHHRPAVRVEVEMDLVEGAFVKLE